MKDLVAFYPYTYDQLSYICLTQQMIEEKYEVISYDDLKKGVYDILSLRTIYLNWFENDMTDEDRKLLKKARLFGKKIVWVFHNKIQHDCKNRKLLISNIQFLIKISTTIIIHSHKSIQFLREYVPSIDVKKIKFVPLMNFIGDYGNYGMAHERLNVKTDEFVFAIYGLIRPYKNIEIIIKAFQQMDRKYKCKLVIAGNPVNEAYVEELKQLIMNDDRICFETRYCPGLEMASYIELADILVLPYDVKSGLNSAVMIMAFSYKTPVIVSDIGMAEEYDDLLIYKYTYDDEIDHVAKLKGQMERAYIAGKTENRVKGEKLYELVATFNSKEIVREQLLCLL